MSLLKPKTRRLRGPVVTATRSLQRTPFRGYHAAWMSRGLELFFRDSTKRTTADPQNTATHAGTGEASQAKPNHDYGAGRK